MCFATIYPQGPKYPSIRYLPQNITTIPNIEALDTVYLGTLESRGMPIGPSPCHSKQLILSVYLVLEAPIAWKFLRKAPNTKRANYKPVYCRGLKADQHIIVPDPSCIYIYTYVYIYIYIFMYILVVNIVSYTMSYSHIPQRCLKKILALVHGYSLKRVLKRARGQPLS